MSDADTKPGPQPSSRHRTAGYGMLDIIVKLSTVLASAAGLVTLVSWMGWPAVPHPAALAVQIGDNGSVVAGAAALLGGVLGYFATRPRRSRER